MITPYHPIFVNDQWKFPIDVSNISIVHQDIDYVYSFVIKTESHMIIDNVQCITLGHYINNDSVASHKFFGTELVISAIERLQVDGVVTITPDQILREKTNDGTLGRVIDIIR
jgi:hypothetical protein